MSVFSDLSNRQTCRSASQDSCSTVTSENEFQHETFFFSETESNPVFKVYIRCAVKKKGKIVYSETACFGKSNYSKLKNAGKACGILQIDKHLYQRCWHATPIKTFSDDINFIFDSLWSKIEGHQTELHFNYVIKEQKTPSVLHCSSIDVYGLTGSTSVHNTPLKPFHRGHYQLRDESAWCDERGNKGIELWICDQVAFFVCTEISSSLSEANHVDCSKKILATPMSSHLKKNSKKRTSEDRLSKRKSKLSKKNEMLVVYTSGIRISTKDISNGRKVNMLLNPDFRRGSSARILVARSNLKRSVKLLTILPHIQYIVQYSWLKKCLIRGSCTPFEMERYQFSEVRKRDSFENINKFSLSQFLQVPICVRETLLSDFNFWLHDQVEPQEPPLNDIRTVIAHSGGTVSKALKNANILLLPSLEHHVLQTVESDCKNIRCVSKNYFVVVPDQLFKCILQQNTSLLRIHIIPISIES